MEVHDAKRTAKMAAMYAAGVTLQGIGDKYGISRERVRQHLTKRYGFKRRDGGKHLVTKRALEARAAKAETACQKKHGCSRANYLMLRSDQGTMTRFISQRNNANRRGIEWKLKLWEWWTVWQDSGHWDERGRGMKKYVMCRFGDKGPYTVGNVRIATSADNLNEMRSLRGWAQHHVNSA